MSRIPDPIQSLVEALSSACKRARLKPSDCDDVVREAIEYVARKHMKEVESYSIKDVFCTEDECSARIGLVLGSGTYEVRALCFEGKLVASIYELVATVVK